MAPGNLNEANVHTVIIDPIMKHPVFPKTIHKQDDRKPTCFFLNDRELLSTQTTFVGYHKFI